MTGGLQAEQLHGLVRTPLPSYTVGQWHGHLTQRIQVRFGYTGPLIILYTVRQWPGYLTQRIQVRLGFERPLSPSIGQWPGHLTQRLQIIDQVGYNTGPIFVHYAVMLCRENRCLVRLNGLHTPATQSSKGQCCQEIQRTKIRLSFFGEH